MTWIKYCCQLLRLTGNPVWADEMEISLYNALAGAMVPDGHWWAYHSALTGERVPSQKQHQDPGVSCCMMNAPRALFLTPRWAIMTSAEGPVVNFYETGISNVPLDTGISVQLIQTTDYPVSESIRIQVIPEKEAEFTLRLRIPGWCEAANIAITNESTDSRSEKISVSGGEYAALKRIWKPGDTVFLEIPMKGRVIEAPGCRTQLAIMRGPVLLALDNRFVNVDDNDVLLTRNDQGNVDLTPVVPTPDGVKMAFSVPFDIHPTHFFFHSKVTLTMCDFASAGNQWGPDNLYRCWLPQPLWLPHAFVPNTWKLLNANPPERPIIPPLN